MLRRGRADIVLLGDATDIKNRASGLGFSLDGADVVSMTDPELVERFAQEYARLRATKGATLEQARAKMTVLVVPTNEELQMAREVSAVIA